MAHSSPPATEEKRPSLPGSQRKTALRDFIVRFLFVFHTITDRMHLPNKRIFSFSTWLDKAIFVVALVSSLGVGATMPAMNIIFGMHLAENDHLESWALLSIMQVGWWVHSPDTSARILQRLMKCSTTPLIHARKHHGPAQSQRHPDSNYLGYILSAYLVSDSLLTT